MGPWIARLAVILFSLTPFICAAPAIPPEITTLLRGPDRLEIRTKLSITKPVLTFHQQHRVIVIGNFSRKMIESGAIRKLHIVVKVQDANGDWLEGFQYTSFEVPEELKNRDFEYRTSVYLRPGKYRLGVVFLEHGTGRSDVFHVPIEISPIKNDPLPALNGALPVVEFPDEYPDGKGMWPISARMKRLPVYVSNPHRLDVVLNVTKGSESDWLYRRQAEIVFATGSVLGRLAISSGCVRVSVIDAMRMKVVLDRQNADDIDWLKLQQDIEELDQNTIDVSALENQRRIAEFTQRYIESLARDSSGCESDDAETAPMTAVVSADLVLPLGSKIPRTPLKEQTRLFYFHLGFGTSWMDGVGQILSSGKPVKFNCTNPHKVRKGLAELVSQLATEQNSATH